MPNEIFLEPRPFSWPGAASGKLLGPWERRQQAFAAPVEALPLPGARCLQGCHCLPRGMQPAQMPRCRQQPLRLHRKTRHCHELEGYGKILIASRRFLARLAVHQYGLIHALLHCCNEIENIPSAASAMAAASAVSCALGSCSAKAIKLISFK